MTNTVCFVRSIMLQPFRYHPFFVIPYLWPFDSCFRLSIRLCSFPSMYSCGPCFRSFFRHWYAFFYCFILPALFHIRYGCILHGAQICLLGIHLFVKQQTIFVLAPGKPVI